MYCFMTLEKIHDEQILSSILIHQLFSFSQKSKLPIDYAELSRSSEAIKLLFPFTQVCGNG